MRKMLTGSAIAVLTLAAGQSHAAIIQYQAILSGLSEVPPNASPATGTVDFDFDDVTNTLTLTSGGYNGLLSDVTAAHIHGAAPVGVNAGVLIALTHSGGTTGTLSMPATVLTAAQVGFLQGDLLYVNVHSINFGGGEIRGQIMQVPAPGALALLGMAGLITTARRRR